MPITHVTLGWAKSPSIVFFYPFPNVESFLLQGMVRQRQKVYQTLRTILLLAVGPETGTSDIKSWLWPSTAALSINQKHWFSCGAGSLWLRFLLLIQFFIRKFYANWLGPHRQAVSFSPPSPSCWSQWTGTCSSSTQCPRRYQHFRWSQFKTHKETCLIKLLQ